MGNYNDHLMEQLADQGDGFYRYVDTYDEAERPVRRRAHHALRRSPTTRGAGRVRPRAGRRPTGCRLRQPGHGRRVVRATSASMRASSAPATRRPRCTRSGLAPGVEPGHADRHRPGCAGSPPPPARCAWPRRRCSPPTPRPRRATRSPSPTRAAADLTRAGHLGRSGARRTRALRDNRLDAAIDIIVRVVTTLAERGCQPEPTCLAIAAASANRRLR